MKKSVWSKQDQAGYLFKEETNLTKDFQIFDHIWIHNREPPEFLSGGNIRQIISSQE